MPIPKTITEPRREVPVIRAVDVVVAGGGPAGLAAAIAAARSGVEVLLIERYGFLGGMITTGLVTGLPGRELLPHAEKKPLIAGIAKDFVDRLIDEGGIVWPSEVPRSGEAPKRLPHYPVDPEMVKLVALNMLDEVGATLLLHTYSVGTVVEKGQIEAVIVESKTGRKAILTEVVIDGTGDGDVAVAAGAPYDIDPNPLPLSLNFHMANVDTERARNYNKRPLMERKIQEAIETGDLPIPKERFFAHPQVNTTTPFPTEGRNPLPYELRFSTFSPPPSYVGRWVRKKEIAVFGANIRDIDGSNVEDLTRAEITTRRLAGLFARFLKKYIPGFEEAYLLTTAPQIGIRETKRIIGDYVLTKKDVVWGGRFHDVIARGTCWREPGPSFDIPYRCLVPKRVDGLLVAGRCISIDREAAKLLSPREISCCMATGQAAGTAAGIAIRDKVIPRHMDINKLQALLREEGANLG